RGPVRAHERVTGDPDCVLRLLEENAACGAAVDRGDRVAARRERARRLPLERERELAAALSAALSVPRKGTTSEPVMSCEVGFGAPEAVVDVPTPAPSGAPMTAA